MFTGLMQEALSSKFLLKDPSADTSDTVANYKEAEHIYNCPQSAEEIHYRTRRSPYPAIKL